MEVGPLTNSSHPGVLRQLSDWFRSAAHQATLFSGSWQFFLVSVIGIVAWAVLGPPMDYSNTWQLIVNTPTTVLT